MPGNVTEELKTDAEWRALSLDDPMYAVASWPGKQRSWRVDEFYAVGRSDWDDFRRHWKTYDSSLGGTCLEIGCGLGRITHALALNFDRVIGVDVAPEMLRRARSFMPSHVDLREVSGTALPLPTGSVDAVFSTHVFQHLDSLRIVRAYLAEVGRVLRPNGSFMLHIALASRSPTLPWRTVQRTRITWNRWRAARGHTPTYYRTRSYRAEDIRRLLEELPIQRVELREFRVRSNGGLHPFWFGIRE